MVQSVNLPLNSIVPQPYRGGLHTRTGKTHVAIIITYVVLRSEKYFTKKFLFTMLKYRLTAIPAIVCSDAVPKTSSEKPTNLQAKWPNNHWPLRMLAIQNGRCSVAMMMSVHARFSTNMLVMELRRGFLWMVTTTKKLPTMQAIHIKTAIVTSMPTCNGVRPRGSYSNSWILLVFFPSILWCRIFLVTSVKMR